MRALRILVVHNRYQQPGGEDQVFEAETALLRTHGHPVETLVFDNRSIGSGARPLERLGTAAGTIWSRGSAAQVRRAVRNFRPDVVHFHNTFPLISPAAYYAVKEERVAVVQTLHNYRIVCPSSTLFRDGQVCQSCVGRRLASPALRHRCYRDSTAYTAVVTAMLGLHRGLGTWSGAVDRYLALSEFARGVFVSGGLEPVRVLVKPNFVDPDPGPGEHRGGFVLYAGRLIDTKGVLTLLDVWRRGLAPLPLKIIGDGPLREVVAQAARDCPDIEWLGGQPQPVVNDYLGQAAALIVPSEWPEPFGRVIVEAFARATPVIAARSGAIPEIVAHGETGLLFPPGDAVALAEQLGWAGAQPRALRVLGKAARQDYQLRFTAETNYALLLDAYTQALAKS